MDPETLYHYTDAAGLIGIVTGKEIWASQLQFMNDREEFTHARGGGAKIIREQIQNYPTETQEFFAKVAEKLERGNTITRTFAFSLSEQPDLLSQWRGYAPNGGYCLGFSTKYLHDLSQRHSMTLLPCCYNDSIKTKNIREILDAYVDVTSSGKLKGEQEGEFIATLVQDVRAIAPIFKHRSFEEEAEWRMWGMVPIGDPRSKWRPRGPLVHPYAVLALCEPRQGTKILNEIFIGPGLDRELAYHPLSFMLKEAGLDCDVKFSGSPLR